MSARTDPVLPAEAPASNRPSSAGGTAAEADVSEPEVAAAPPYPQPEPQLRLRLVLPGDAMFGPGKADLLEGIARTGSIAAAGRDMKMSYKRAWMLVETMNDAFAGPLVESSRGGARGGGARLTDRGARVLKAYRALEAQATEAGRAEIGQIITEMRDIPGGK